MVELINLDVIGYDRISSVPEPAPEPASLAMLGLGVLATAGYGWRRRKTA